jgi:hypothetical protein
MKKQWALATVAAATIVTVAVGSTAGAIPDHKAETWTCGEDEVTLVGTGRSGWIDGVHHLAVYIEFIGVFTPEGGGEPQFEGEEHFYGNRANLVHPEAIRCDVHFEETIPGEGTFVADGHVIAIPVR